MWLKAIAPEHSLSTALLYVMCIFAPLQVNTCDCSSILFFFAPTRIVGNASLLDLTLCHLVAQIRAGSNERIRLWSQSKGERETRANMGFHKPHTWSLCFPI